MSNPITKLVSVIEELILRAVFIGDDTWWRHSSSILGIALATTLVYVGTWCRYGLVIVMITLVLIHLTARTYRLFIYSVILAILPTAWYVLTTIPFTHSLINSLIIGSRVLLNTLSILTAVFMMNPMEISYLLRRLGIKEGAVFPALLWKVIPHTLRDMESALLVNDLKGEGVGKGVAVSILASIEHSRMYEEGLYLKLRFFNPHFSYDPRAILLQVLPIISLITYVLIMNTYF